MFLVSVIKINLGAAQAGKNVTVDVLQMLHMRIHRAQPCGPSNVNLRPETFDRMDDKHVAKRLACLQKNVEAAEVGFHPFVFTIP